MKHKQDHRVIRMSTAHKIKGAYKSFVDALHVATELTRLNARCKYVREVYKFAGDTLAREKAQQKQALLALLDLRRSLLA